jgi:hypothetical protein
LEQMMSHELTALRVPKPHPWIKKTRCKACLYKKVPHQYKDYSYLGSILLNPKNGMAIQNMSVTVTIFLLSDNIQFREWGSRYLLYIQNKKTVWHSDGFNHGS